MHCAEYNVLCPVLHNIQHAGPPQSLLLLMFDLLATVQMNWRNGAGGRYCLTYLSQVFNYLVEVYSFSEDRFEKIAFAFHSLNCIKNSKVFHG